MSDDRGLPTPGNADLDNSPEGRFAAIRQCIRTAQNSLLNASVLLAHAFEAEEWRTLGFASFTAYTGELEIRQSAASKMVRVGRRFAENGRPLWWSLPAHDQAELSIERLYLAARRVEAGQCSVGEAIHDAVAHPPRWHRALLRGDEPLDERPCVCPECGTQHWRRPKDQSLHGGTE
jgi:hypothetical protein